MKLSTRTTVIENDELVVNACNSSKRIYSVSTRPRLVSASKSTEDKYPVFSMPAEEFIDPELCRTSYGIASLSQILISSKEISNTPYKQSGVDSLDISTAKTFVSEERHPVLSSESIVDGRFIGKKNDNQTYKVTTQKGVRSAILPSSRQYRADRYFDRPILKGK